MKTLLATLTLTVTFAAVAFAGPGDQRSFPYGPVPTFTAQTDTQGAPYALTGSTNTTSDALRPTTVWIGGNRDMRSMATFQNAR